jgi:hypothetical protein
MPFAHRLLAAAAGGDSLVLGLVPAAVGGTRIWMWARGQPLYEAAVARARAAVDAGGGTLGAVLWFQGESDTIELDDATAYGGRMERLVNDFRADLGLPDLFLIQVSALRLSSISPPMWYRGVNSNAMQPPIAYFLFIYYLCFSKKEKKADLT